MIETWLIRGLRGLFFAGSLLAPLGVQAALFSDDEARKAIIDLRQRVEAQKATAEAIERKLTDENNQLRRSLLDLQNQIEALRTEQARMRGQGEQMSREIAETQRRQTTQSQSLDERLRSMEPQKVIVDGREFVASPAEKRDFDAAIERKSVMTDSPSAPVVLPATGRRSALWLWFVAGFLLVLVGMSFLPMGTRTI